MMATNKTQLATSRIPVSVGGGRAGSALLYSSEGRYPIITGLSVTKNTFTEFHIELHKNIYFIFIKMVLITNQLK